MIFPLPHTLYSEWSDTRLNVTSVLKTAYGRNIMKRLRVLPMRQQHKFSIWLPHFNLFSRFGDMSDGGATTASLTNLRAANFRRRRRQPDTYRLKAEAQVDAVHDCQMESRRFPFDTTQCLVYLSMDWLRGSPFSPTAAGLPQWYRNADRPSSNISRVAVHIHESSLGRDQISQDEEWRHYSTGVLCKSRSDDDDESMDVECYFLMRFERMSEKYIYPWLATTNVLAVAAIALTYKGSDPGEHYSLGAASLVPCALFLFTLKDQVGCCWNCRRAI